MGKHREQKNKWDVSISNGGTPELSSCYLPQMSGLRIHFFFFFLATATNYHKLSG